MEDEDEQDIETTVLSLVIEQVFDRIEKRLSLEDEKDLITQDYVELNCLFSDEVLSRTFELLDTQTVISYRPETELTELIEIAGSQSSPIVYKLFPNTNYCHCKFFQDKILNDKDNKFYTCEHVLAVRLAKILGLVKVEVLPKHRFNYILKQIAAE